MQLMDTHLRDKLVHVAGKLSDDLPDQLHHLRHQDLSYLLCSYFLLQHRHYRQFTTCWI